MGRRRHICKLTTGLGKHSPCKLSLRIRLYKQLFAHGKKNGPQPALAKGISRAHSWVDRKMYANTFTNPSIRTRFSELVSFRALGTVAPFATASLASQASVRNSECRSVFFSSKPYPQKQTQDTGKLLFLKKHTHTPTHIHTPVTLFKGGEQE